MLLETVVTDLVLQSRPMRKKVRDEFPIIFPLTYIHKKKRKTLMEQKEQQTRALISVKNRLTVIDAQLVKVETYVYAARFFKHGETKLVTL